MKSGTLEMREDVGGLRHWLDGEEVHAGVSLDLNLGRWESTENTDRLVCDEGGPWLRGRYEWNFQRDSGPRFIVGGAPGHRDIFIRIEGPFVLRWPPPSTTDPGDLINAVDMDNEGDIPL